LPDSGGVWRVDEVDNSVFPAAESYYQYISMGDSIINGNSWIKIYVSGAWWVNTGTPYYSSPPGNLRGLIRYDSLLHKLIVYVDTTMIGCDSVIFDFSLNAGDTLYPQNACNFQGSSYDTLLIGSVDSVLVGSNYRKRLNVYDYHFGGNYTGVSLIEGVGSSQGLFEGYYYFEQYHNLFCFIVNGQSLYPSSSSNCDLIEHLDEYLSNENQLFFYPNPSNGIFYLHNNMNEIIEVSEVYNYIGEKVFEKEGNIREFNLSGSARGIYFVKMSSGEKMWTQKLVIE
jgi:hypothetical protein